MNDSDKVDEQRVYWHSRRGMLELDLVLMPFAREVYPSLDAAARQSYRGLLECEDADIFAWLVHGVRPRQSEFDAIIDRIRAHGRASAQRSD
jgi:antitoxin CptB